MVRIFIVDDDYSLQKLYSLILKEAGFEIVDTAFNGRTAIEKFNNHKEKPDIILMDHRMPMKNGLEAMEEILQTNNRVKIIFASADISVKQKAISLGACAFLDKPFNMRKLLRIIQNVCDDFMLKN